MKTYVIEGGLGKQILFSALLPELAKKEQIIILTSYPDIFYNNKYVYRSINFNTPYSFEDIISKNDIVYFEPYWDNDFIKRKKHILESWCNGFKIEYNKINLPCVTIPKESYEIVEQIKNKHNKYIIIQFTGGQSPLNVNLNEKFNDNGLIKQYDFNNACLLVKLIKKKYPNLHIINYSIPNESLPIPDTERLQIPYMHYFALLKESEIFISIDSSLQHMAAAVDKPGIVLWGATSPKQFGYKMHINLTNQCPYGNIHCMRPYLREMGDYVSTGEKWKCGNPLCIDIKPHVILEKLKI